ncbi:hypothetical protein NQ176_g7181 [Zarea fungicola]|uniref:Uncharacterized protein n=1 Tax=Zarea fungicola TaxID=93591 RepID=A0ACC1N0U9_9HYPO|nr:hypothetical protein NQ176_g7181 [Lecanicillium fungicola]
MLSTYYLMLAAVLGRAYAVTCGDANNVICSKYAEPNSLQEALQEIQGLHQDNQYTDGQCLTLIPSPQDSAFCVYFSGTGASWTAAQAGDFVQQLLNAGCDACASVSTGDGAGQLIASYFN